MVELDEAAIARWLEPIASDRGDVAEVFVETRRRTAVDWRDGEPGDVRVAMESGTSARLRRGGRERLAFVSGSGEAEVREAIRALASSSGKSGVPSRAGPPAPLEAEPDASIDRWVRRLGPVFARHASKGRLTWSLVAIERRVIPAGLPPARSERRLFSLEGSFTAASRRGDETRAFSFHAPEADSTADELKLALTAASLPREQPVPFGDPRGDVLFSGGTAAVLFHEILSHALEAGAEESPLSRLTEARVSAPDLDVRDDPSRLDLFGGYERDDEGTRPRIVKLLDSGRLGGALSDRSHGGARGSTGHGRRAGPADFPLPRGSNTVVSPGQATTEEMLRRLANGLWIDEIASGSIELASGQWRLEYPHARRVRRGRFADEVGPGILAGEILSTLSSVEPVIGREVRPCRSLGWCSRAGQVVPVQGAAPDVLVRRLSVRDR